jgi:hypothetical protein
MFSLVYESKSIFITTSLNKLDDFSRYPSLSETSYSMKIRFVLSILVVCLFGCKHHPVDLKENPAQMRVFSDSGRVHYNDITDIDRKNYTLTASVLSTDSDSCYGKKNVAYILSVVLKNNSKDTLKFVDYTCSHFIWTTDNKMISVIAGEGDCFGCDSNMLSESDLPPHTISKYQLLAEFIKNVSFTEVNFRVGIILQRILKTGDMNFYFEHYDGSSNDLEYQTQNITWSNIIQISD